MKTESRRLKLLNNHHLRIFNDYSIYIENDQSKGVYKIMQNFGENIEF